MGNLKNLFGFMLLAVAFAITSCQTDACKDITCPTGQVCDEGTCKDTTTASSNVVVVESVNATYLKPNLV